MKLFPPGQTCSTIIEVSIILQLKETPPLDWQKALTTRWTLATFLPKALSSAALRLGWTRLYNASHDIFGVVRARIISRSSCIRYSSPGLPAYVFVEADAVFSPIVGAVSSNLGKDRGGENEEGKERGKDYFHDAWFFG